MLEADSSGEIGLTLEAYNLEKAAQIVSAKFLEELKRISKKGRFVYVFKERSKGAKGIYDKVIRKRRQGAQFANYGVNNIGDAWGCRFVTHFQEDVVNVVSELLSFARGRQRAHEDISLVRISIYDNRPDNDPLSIAPKIKEAVEKRGLQHPTYDIRKQSRDTGYSSVHLIFQTKVEVNLPGQLSSDTHVHFEVQVRDIFEEGWSEISHLLSYGGRSNGHKEENESRRLHLNALKAVADGCSQHANLLRPNALQVRSNQSEARAYPITDLYSDCESILEALPDGNESLRERIIQAYNLQAEAFQTTKEELDRSVAQPFYAAAAKLFDDATRVAKNVKAADISVSLVHDGSKKNYERSVRYFLETERANAIIFSLPERRELFSVSDIKEFDSAISIYNKLVEKYNSDLSLMIRLGQALIKGSTRTEEINKGIDCLRNTQKFGEIQQQFPRGHWIHLDIAYYMGRAYYRLARRSKSIAEKKKKMALAIDEIEKVLPADIHDIISAEHDEQKIRLYHRLITSALYFRCMLPKAEIMTPSPDDFKAGQKKFIRLYVNLLTNLPLSLYGEKFLESIDNIMIGAFVIGDDDLALETAHKHIGYLLTVARQRKGKTRDQRVALSGEALDHEQKDKLDRANYIIHALEMSALKNLRSRPGPVVPDIDSPKSSC